MIRFRSLRLVIPGRLLATQAVKKLVLLVVMLAVMPAHAQLGTALTEAELMVRVVTGPGRPADCLAPVAVTRVDGQLKTVPAQGFLIEPGIHTINGRATLDFEQCGVTDNQLQIGTTLDLEVNFEAGNTYYIAYDHKSQNTDDWNLVVWMVEKDKPSEPPSFLGAGQSNSPQDDTQ